MDNQLIEIEQFAKLSGLSVSTIRRKIKSLPETDKNAFIRRVPVVGSGGEKILIDKAWLGMMNTHDKASKETIQEQPEQHQEQIKEPEINGSILEILKGQIEYLQRQNETKDGQISELLERLKESQYNLASMQKQLTAPQEQTPGDSPKWWQFWK